VIGPRALRLALGACALFVLCAGTAAQAAPMASTIDVTIQNFAFAPVTITIEKGDMIRWTNLDSAPHGAVTVQPGFVTQILGQGQSTTTTFERPGTFDYICNVHGASMRGTVVVRGTPVAETPATAAPLGHIVVDTFADARPDRLDASATGPSLLLYASVVLALIVVARFVWVLRTT
jgi:plastocyanin